MTPETKNAIKAYLGGLAIVVGAVVLFMMLALLDNKAQASGPGIVQEEAEKQQPVKEPVADPEPEPEPKAEPTFREYEIATRDAATELQERELIPTDEDLIEVQFESLYAQGCVWEKALGSDRAFLKASDRECYLPPGGGRIRSVSPN